METIKRLDDNTFEVTVTSEPTVRQESLESLQSQLEVEQTELDNLLNRDDVVRTRKAVEELTTRIAWLQSLEVGAVSTDELLTP